MLLARRFMLGGIEHPVYLCDSFQGLPPVTDKDGPLARRYQNVEWPDRYFDNCRASAEAIVDLLERFDFTERDYRIAPGWFEETLPSLGGELKDSSIALLRLDADWYDSTMNCLIALAPLVHQDGLVILGDYYAWDGCTLAVHDYFTQQRIPYRIRSIPGQNGAYFYMKAVREDW